MEVENRALRLTPDEWIVSLYGNDFDRERRDAIREPVERLQWQVAERSLALGCDVILDWGFWSRAERDDMRRRAHRLGAAVSLVYLDAPTHELWERIATREESRSGTLGITRPEFEEWAAEFEPPTEEERSSWGGR